MIRRSFLKLMGASPVALPVIARESTAAALTAPANISGLISTSTPDYAISDMDLDVDDELDGKYLQHYIRNLVRRRKNHLSEDITVNKLDPDLACMKSFSLSTVIRIQKARNKEIRNKQTTESIRDNFNSNKAISSIIDFDSFLKICDTDEATIEKFIDGLNFDNRSNKAG